MEFQRYDEFTPGSRIHYGGAVIGPEEVDVILGAIEEGNGRNWTIGRRGEAFESALSSYIGDGYTYTLLVNSGSSALLLALHGLNLPKGSIVALPATTFPTAFNAIVQAGYVPLLIDTDPRNFNLMIEELHKIGKRYVNKLKAILAVAIAGNIPNMDQLRELADFYKVPLILDNCDGFGGLWKGEPVEKFADIACTSFHAAHIVSMGEGGAIFTSHYEWYGRMRQLRDWGREGATDEPSINPMLPEGYPQRYSYEVMGYNLKPLELQAAMGLVQFGKLQQFKQERAANFAYLKSVFDACPQHFKTVAVEEGADPCWFSFPLFVLNNKRTEFATYLESRNIETRPIFAGNIAKHRSVLTTVYKKIGSLGYADLVMEGGMFISVSPRNPQSAYEYIKQCVDKYVANNPTT
jgi:CDP-4-dehydro-6-deoxyglucose reductase, E1